MSTKRKAARRIEMVPLSKLKPAKRNPKRHDTKSLTASVGRFGFVEPMVLDERTGRLVSGHGRLEVLLALRGAGGAPPIGVEARGKDWLAPVLCGWRSKDDADAEAYLVAANRLVEAGGWDHAELDSVLSDLAAGGAAAMVGLDVTPGYLEALLRPLSGDDVDETPPPPNVTSIKPGDLFALGDHRLLCGDSTKAGDVMRLMGIERAGLMNTDPPYGVAYTNDARPNPGVATPRVATPRVANDQLSDARLQAFLESAFRVAASIALRPDAAWYLWHAHLTQGFFAAAAAAAAANVVLSRQIIWVKPTLLLTRGQYHWRHEPCFFGWVEGHQPPDYGRGDGERNQTTVWELAGVTPAERKELNHSTPKPVAIFEIPITKHLQPGEVCFEPFAGSGPQFIAAERLKRRCFGLELEPRFCSVIIARWEKLTGARAERLPSGVTPAPPSGKLDQ